MDMNISPAGHPSSSSSSSSFSSPVSAVASSIETATAEGPLEGTILTESSSSLPRSIGGHEITWLYHVRSKWKPIVLGQCLSIALAGIGAAQATLHLDCDLSAPTFNIAMIYLLLSFQLFILYFRQQRQSQQHQHQQIQQSPPLTTTTTTTTFQDTHPPTSIVQAHQEINDSRTPGFNSDLGSEPDFDTETTMAGRNDHYRSTILIPASTARYTFEINGTPVLKLHRPFWQYMAMAFLDVEANYCTYLAFRYTTLTSVTLLDSLAIPSAMFLSRVYLKRQYTTTHLCGVLVCMAGVVLNLLQDYESDRLQDAASDPAINKHIPDQISPTVDPYPHKFRGDLLAIIGGCLYGVNDVITEASVRSMQGSTEYLGMIGLCAFLISFVQAWFVEYDDILKFWGRGPDDDASSTCSLEKGWSLYATFVLLSAVGYVGAAQFLRLSEATFYNLSLLTGDLWSVLFSVFAERIIPRPFFFLALLLVIGGVLIYETAPSPASEDRNGHPNMWTPIRNEGETNNSREHICTSQAIYNTATISLQRTDSGFSHSLHSENFELNENMQRYDGSKKADDSFPEDNR